MKDNNQKYFLYVGSLYSHKNLQRAIDALSLLNKEGKNRVYLYIVSARNIFEKKLKTNEFVKFLGFIPDEELKQLYENSLGFIYPSLVEGFGLPGIEAMKNGTILVASHIPVFREVYENMAIYFDPLDEKSIKEAMEKVINMDGKEREKLIEKYREFVKRYSWNKMAKETLEVYIECYNEI